MHKLSRSPLLRAGLLASLFIGQAAAMAKTAVVRDDMAQRMQACVVCHGKEGRATSAGYFPRIAGKPAGYLYAQLLNFRDGRRKNTTMAYLTGQMSDAYLKEIAAYFSSQDLPYPPPQVTGADAGVLARGEQLIRRGDAGRGIPACSQCHGQALTGVQTGMPGLIGLPRDYVLAQLGGWRTGLRHAAAPDCMAEVAKQLTLEEVTAVATWLSSQPVISGPSPATSLPSPLPLPCGSGAQ